MSDPTVTCKTCARQRSCMLHLRADFPPDAARKWLRKTCERGRKDCDLVYRVGIELRGRLTGQENFDEAK